MKVAVQLEFRLDRKEPFGALLRRAAAAFAAAGLEPRITASFSDGIVPRRQLGRRAGAEEVPGAGGLRAVGAAGAGGAPVRRLTSDRDGPPFPAELLLALADGMPRSLPFFNATVVCAHPEFGTLATPAGDERPGGVNAMDAWWVNGRNRSLNATYVVAAENGSKTLPGASPGAAAVIAALGKPKKTSQYVVPERPAAAAAADALAAS